MSKKNAIVIHHTFSAWGDVSEIRKWHKSRGWRDIGYHKVILNGFPSYKSFSSGKKNVAQEGAIKQGRPDNQIGAHTKEGNMNRLAFGVCVVGNFDSATPSQKLVKSVINCCVTLCKRHGIGSERIFFHRDWAINKRSGKPYKTCPGTKFPPREEIRFAVADILSDY